MEAYLTPERETLLALLEAANIEVVQNAPMCWEKKNKYAGFALSYPSSQEIEVIICTNAIMEVAKGMRFVSELNRTIDHEALHAAQFCKHNYSPGSISDDWTTDGEIEAQSYEGRPQAVGDKLIEFCF